MELRVWESIDTYAGYWLPLALACLLIGCLVGVIALSSLASPPIESAPTVNEHGNIDQTVSTQSVVQNETPLYSPGDVVKNASIYTHPAMSNATISSQARFPTKQSFNATQNITMTLAVSSSEGTTFWTNQTVLASSTKQIGPDTKPVLNTETTIDMSEVHSQLAAIQQSYYGRATITAEITVTTQYTGEGGSDVVTNTLPISVGENTYQLGEGSASAAQPYTTTTMVSQPAPFKHAGPLGSISLFLLFLSGISFACHRHADPTRTHWEYDLQSFDDWVSEGTVNITTYDHAFEETSLSDLVDVAIDSDTRVVHDAEKGLCLITTDAGRTIHYCTRDSSDWELPE